MKDNVLVIIADQLRQNAVGPHKTLPILTPNLDRLWQDSIVFENSYTQSPVCAPARCSILTGKIPEKTGSILNPGLIPMRSVQPDDFNWIKCFAQRGYRTSHFGKWNISATLDPCAYGYHDYLSLTEFETTHKGKTADIDNEVAYFLEAGWADDDQETSAEWLSRRLCERFSKTDDGFVMQVELTEPHIPYHPKRRFADLYRNVEVVRYPSFDHEAFLDKPYIQRQQLYTWGVQDFTFEDYIPLLKNYYALVTQLDESLGVIIDGLKQSGKYDNTTIVFTSDHGDMCSSHRMYDKHYVMYDDVVRVPFFMKIPGEKHRVYNNAIVNSCLDIAPTLLELFGIGVEPDIELDGRSLLPLIGDTVTETDFREFGTASYSGAQFGLYMQRMIVKGSMKYIWNPTDVDELYDLERDPSECDNVIHQSQYQLILKEMRQLLYRNMVKQGDGLGKHDWAKNQLMNNMKL